MTKRYGKFCRFVALLSVVGAFYAPSAMAVPRDAMIEGAKQCTQHFPTHERLNGIPTHLLAAIAATESGRYNKTLGMVLPWPWTVNANGQGYYLDTKAEAVAKVKSLQAKGIKSIDVGCMQVNLYHHPNAFASLDQAFDPRYNIAYSAKFLRRNYDDLGTWVKATGAYHSRTPKFGNIYLGKIEKSWRSIVGKVREARASRGMDQGQYSLAADRDFDALSRAFTNHASRVPVSEVDGRAGLSASSASSRTGVSSRSMKMISVREPSDRSRENVMVIRPTHVPAKASVSVSDDKPSATRVASIHDNIFVLNTTKTSANTGSSFVKTSGVTNKTTPAKPSAQSAPKFIFVD